MIPHDACAGFGGVKPNDSRANTGGATEAQTSGIPDYDLIQVSWTRHRLLHQGPPVREFKVE